MTTEMKTLDMSSEEFKKAGYLLVDEIAKFMDELPKLKVTPAESPTELQKSLPDTALPNEGMPTDVMLKDTMSLLVNHSLFNGHPKFWGYITSSAAPIGALADLLAASVNPNVGAQTLSPIATEIERQTIQWLSDLLGYRQNCGGIFVSGGNMANLVPYMSAKKHQVPNPEEYASDVKFTVYCANGTHTWIHKACNLFGQGRDVIRWINTKHNGQIDTSELQTTINNDIAAGHIPFMVVANGGTVEAGVVDPLIEIHSITQQHNIWMHVDGAYGAPAAALAENKDMFKGIDLADSIAIDPHKWLYSPIEAGCVLVRDGQLLKNAFSHNPHYYNFDGNGQDAPLNYHEYGLQNSRGFKALKVWLSLKQVGRKGIEGMIRKDITLAAKLHELVNKEPELEAVSHNLSITTFRYIPGGDATQHTQEYLNELNQSLLDNLQKGGKVFLSNAIINGNYCLRVCIVNFRTEEADLKDLVAITLEEGAKLV